MPTRSYEEVQQDLLTNPRYQEFFAPYHPTAVERFASSYALARAQWFREGADAEYDQTAALTQFSDLAYTRLWDIQRKKLFDLQCRWRAGLVSQPGLDCTFDFITYDAAIENCPVLPPITPDELALYCDFVREADDFEQDVLDKVYVDDWAHRDWQDYHGMRLHEEEFEQDVPYHLRRGEEGPAWYDFHNTRTGNGQLLRLPDVRKPREKPYLDAYYAARRAEHPRPPAPADPRPTVLGYEQGLELQAAFIKQFESAQLRRCHAAFLARQARDEANEQARKAFKFLQNLDPDEEIAFEPAPDWRTALHRTAVAVKRRQLLAYLPRVYEEYLLREKQGISHPEADEPQWRNTLGPEMRENILIGRELLGEPRDFNF